MPMSNLNITAPAAENPRASSPPNHPQEVPLLQSNGTFQPGHGPPTAPIIAQPPGQPMGQPGGWMSIPAGIPNCPRGLEYLATVDQLLVQQKVGNDSAGYEGNNIFCVKNALGQKVYYAVENTDCCTLCFCGTSRAFDMQIYDNFRNEVIHLYRPDSGLLKSMEVSSPPGNIIGTIKQEFSVGSPAFKVRNHLGETVLRIKGPIFMSVDATFHIVSLTDVKVGKIAKQWSGLAREIFTNADHYGVTFPLDMDVRMKALLLGAIVLIDIMYFDN